MNDTIKYQIENSSDDWSVTHNNVTLITSDIVKSYLKIKYGGFTCESLYETFTLYNDISAADLSRALTAWNAEYNPLDNYNGDIEHILIHEKGDEVTTHITGDENGEHNTLTSQALNGTSTNTYVTTFDNDTPRLESKDETNGGTETINDLFTTDTKAHYNITKNIDGTNYTGDEITHEIERKHGNLGVTKTQQMIMSEVNMRLNPLIKQYLDRFIFEYAYYVKGAWDICY